MYVQKCIKGISGETRPGAADGITWLVAEDMIRRGTGILSNWWRNKGTIKPNEVQAILTSYNFDQHLHHYAAYGANSPFISLAAGFVQRDPRARVNDVYSAKDTALKFATKYWRRPGALFYCWTIVGTADAVEVSSVSEAVRDTLIYRRWSQFQHQGEITAKVGIPANQVSRVEWWDGSFSNVVPRHTFDNLGFVQPDALIGLREFF